MKQGTGRVDSRERSAASAPIGDLASSGASAHPAHSRERLIAATRELLWERGYAATSPHDVLVRAGVGKGSMYYHFAGKHDLALAALERNCEDVVRTARQVLTGPGTPIERIDAFLTLPRDGLKGCKAGRMTQDPQVRADPTLREPIDRAFAQTRELLADAIRQGARDGAFPASTDADSLAAALVAVVQGAYVLGQAAQSQGAFDAAIAGARALLRAAQAPGAPSMHAGAHPHSTGRVPVGAGVQTPAERKTTDTRGTA